MKKSIQFIFILLLINSFCKAQVTGYMGKKWLIFYDIQTRPSFVRPNQNKTHGLTSFNFKNTFSLEYVPAKYVSVGTSFSTFKTGFDFRGITYSYLHIEDNTYPMYYPRDIGDMSVNSYSIYIKYYIRKSLAPLGTYFKLQLEHFKWDWTFNKNRTLKDSAPAGFPDKGSFDSYGISAFFGRNLIYKDHYVLNTSIQVGFLFNGAMAAIEDRISDVDKVGFTPEIYMKQITSDRLFIYNLWSINIGIGYLLF